MNSESGISICNYTFHAAWHVPTLLDASDLGSIGGEKVMSINELLLSEFDEEMKKTRTTLERVPTDKADFAPHPKSMVLGKLAPHVAELAGFGATILTTPRVRFF
jgi:hypothetical protein